MTPWYRQPLTHFIIIGAALFGLDAALADGEDDEATSHESADADDPYRIVVSDERVDELTAALEAQLQRPATPEEIEATVAQWIEEEALRREAIALGLDQDDPIIRRRLIQNMRFLLDGAAPPDAPTDAAVDAWIAENLPAPEARTRVDFEHVFFDASRRDAPLDDAAAVDTSALSDATGVGDPFIRGRTFRRVGRPEIARTLGDDAAEPVLALEEGVWSEPISSPYGVHLVRVTARHVPPASGTDAERDAARRAISRDATVAASRAAIQEVVDKYEPVRNQP